MVATEIGVKKWSNIFERAQPGHDMLANKQQGLISVDWRRVCRVQAINKQPPDLLWIQDEVNELGPKKDEIKRALYTALDQSSGDDSQWCS